MAACVKVTGVLGTGRYRQFDTVSDERLTVDAVHISKPVPPPRLTRKRERAQLDFTVVDVLPAA